MSLVKEGGAKHQLRLVRPSGLDQIDCANSDEYEVRQAEIEIVVAV